MKLYRTQAAASTDRFAPSRAARTRHPLAGRGGVAAAAGWGSVASAAGSRPPVHGMIPADQFILDNCDFETTLHRAISEDFSNGAGADNNDIVRHSVEGS